MQLLVAHVSLREFKWLSFLVVEGPHIVEINDQFQWDDKNDPEKLFEKLQGYCDPRSN